MSVAIAIICLGLGGLLKGATGAGSPLLAIPALAMLYDVKIAVAIMIVPSLVTNLWQSWQFRRQLLPTRFVLYFSLAGALGALVGSWFLAFLPRASLSLIVALAVLGFLFFRLARPNWRLSYDRGLPLSAPLGFLGGWLQGTSGISAPVSISFLNSMNLERHTFIATISVFFVAMSIVQIPALGALEIMTWERLAISAAATIPILVCMPLGSWLGRRFSKQTFDRVILAVLGCLAVKLIFDALS